MEGLAASRMTAFDNTIAFLSRLQRGQQASLCLKWAGILSLAGFGLLFLALSRDTPPGRAEAFFLIPVSGDPLSAAARNKTTINFNPVETKNGTNKHALRLQSSDAGKLLASPTIGLHLVSNWKSGEVISAKIVFTDQATGKETARFTAKKGSPIRENRKLEFFRKAPVSAEPFPDAQNVEIRIVSRGCPDLAIVGQFSGDEPVSNILWTPAVSSQGVPGITSACGWYEADTGSKAFSTARLLAYTWGFGTDGVRLVYGGIFAACLVWLLGILALTRSFPTGGLPSKGIVFAAGGSLLFLSIGMVYAILVPPFQAPDEPDHFLTYAALSQRGDLAPDALRLANAGHFERIKFRTDERFTAMDVAKPMRDGWAYHIGASEPNRSIIARVIWSLAGQAFATGHSGIALLGLRLLNVAFVAICLGLSLALAAWAIRPEQLSAFILAPAILIPGIGFFSTVLSNYAFLVGGYLVQAVALALLWMEPEGEGRPSRLQPAAAFLAGAGIALASGSADNGVFSSAFWAVLIPMYWLVKGFKAMDVASELRRWLIFSTAFLLGILGVWLTVASVAADFQFLPPRLISVFDGMVARVRPGFVGGQTLMASAFLLPVILGSAILLNAGLILRRFQRLKWMGNVVCVALIAGTVCVGLAKHVMAALPERPAVLHTLAGVTLNFLQGFLPGTASWLVVSSFWGEFGWMDTPVPALLVSLLRFLAAAGLLLLFLLSLRKNAAPAGMGFLAVNIISVIAFISCISVGYYLINIEVNGRYLIGPYLLLLVPACEGFRRLARKTVVGPGGTIICSSCLCLLGIGIQYTAWLSIIHRYF